MNVKRLSDSTYRVCGKVGSKDFLAYFIFVGNCCIEDLTLKACGKEVEEVKGPGCCKRYKKALRELTQDQRKRCEYIAEDVLFQEFSKALDDFRKSPCTN